jgi:hypothetical protein
MTGRDGGLHELLRRRLAGWQLTRIESMAGPGVPDCEYCAPGGVSGWLEYKLTATWRVAFRPFQPAWLSRRAQLGGRAAVLVRRTPAARKHSHLDELWLVDGKHAFDLQRLGLDRVPAICAGDAVRRWDWAAVEAFLRRDPIAASDWRRRSAG